MIYAKDTDSKTKHSFECFFFLLNKTLINQHTNAFTWIPLTPLKSTVRAFTICKHVSFTNPDNASNIKRLSVNQRHCKIGKASIGKTSQFFRLGREFPAPFLLGQGVSPRVARYPLFHVWGVADPDRRPSQGQAPAGAFHAPWQGLHAQDKTALVSRLIFDIRFSS